MVPFWLITAVVLMGLNWLAVWLDWKIVNTFSKPAIMLALLSWLLSTSGFDFPPLWFGIGLAFSLLGDILLLMPGKYFIFGMAAFMITHAVYILGFTRPSPEISAAGITLTVIFFAVWVVFYTSLRKHVVSKKPYLKMEIPIIFYNLLILLMVICAIMTNFNTRWPRAASVLVSCGALLFLFSDVLLGIDRFIIQMPGARLWKRITYQTGQLAIIAGVLLTLSS